MIEAFTPGGLGEVVEWNYPQVRVSFNGYKCWYDSSVCLMIYRQWKIELLPNNFANLHVPTGNLCLQSNMPISPAGARERIDIEWARMSVKKALNS